MVPSKITPPLLAIKMISPNVNGTGSYTIDSEELDQHLRFPQVELFTTNENLIGTSHSAFWLRGVEGGWVIKSRAVRSPIEQ